MKKILSGGMAAVLLLFTLVGCTSGDSSDRIYMISREDGSGTRSAFTELFGIAEKNAEGKRIDNSTVKAEVTNNTSVMMASVAGDPSAIGYISLGSLNDSVKAVSIEGTAPSAAAIRDGSYAVSRPFNIVTTDTLSPVAQDFIDFILSHDGQEIVERKGYVPVDNTGPYSGSKPSGRIFIAGSSSVAPVMEALKETYEARNPYARIDIQQSDSTTGVNSVINGICEIGMASRTVTDSELEAGLTATVIALDGIVIIVNHKSAVSNLTLEQVRQIYTGTLTNWSQLQ